MMLVSNFLFDLYFFVPVISGDSPFLTWLARCTAGLFLLVAGVSMHLRYSGGSSKESARHALLRGAKLFALGMVVTAATRVVAGDGFVVFGILHLIGFGTLLAWPLLAWPNLCLACGLLLVAAAPVVSGLTIDSPWLLWLGVKTPDFFSVDYTPVVPWFGLMLVGVFAGSRFFPAGERAVKAHAWGESGLGRGLAAVGRRSLLIYFLHQPVFLAGFALTGHLGGV